MDVNDNPSQSLIGALEQDSMSSQEEEVGSHHSADEEGDPNVVHPRASRRLVLVGGCQDKPALLGVKRACIATDNWMLDGVLW